MCTLFCRLSLGKTQNYSMICTQIVASKLAEGYEVLALVMLGSNVQRDDYILNWDRLGTKPNIMPSPHCGGIPILESKAALLLLSDELARTPNRTGS